ncbi:MAG: sulfatase-like hydrolase/transferase [Acidobacteriota bacterium]|nr:sulfatase-like hydrolase/transferase [Acidobacteriota bacterium]
MCVWWHLALPESVPTLTEALAAAGYATGAFISSPVLARRYGLARGFDRYDDRIDDKQPRKGLVVHYPERSARWYSVTRQTWLMDQRQRPVFAWIHLWEPHAPYRPPAPFAERFKDDRYQGEVAAADAGVALLDGLRTSGRQERAIVVVTSDHGEGLGAHGEPTHGVFLYQETLHVPLVVYAPAWRVAARAVEGAVSLADIAPTLLDLLGVEFALGGDGESLAPVLAGGDVPAEREVFAESHLPQIDFGWSGLRAWVGGGRKLVAAPRPELYDLRADPAEEHDLAAEQPARVGELAERLDRLVARARALAPDGSSERSASQQDLEMLRSLGYAASGRSVTEEAELVDPHGIDPKDRKAFIARHDAAVALSRQGRLDQAIAEFEALAGIDGNNPSLLLQYGQALIMAHRYQRAEGVFARAVKVAPDFSLAWYRLGQLRGHAGDLDGEAAAYRKAIATDPYDIQPRKALAGVLAQQGRVQAAIDALEAARDLAPHDPAIRAELEKLWAKNR